MLKDKLIGKALSNADLPITIDRSRCMRMRLDQNSCPVCISSCHSGAITIDDKIVINADKCSLCMVCVSECPADCFNIKGGDFFSILARLKNVKNAGPFPVLGCKTAVATEAHEQTVCLGVLSDEHLIAINSLMDRSVQLDLTACAQCTNGFIVDTLKERIAGIRENTGIDVSNKVVLIENKADLRFEAVSYDRRGFFSAVRNMTLLGAAELLENNEVAAIQSYSQKSLPLKRDILNKVLTRNDDRELLIKILQEYAFAIKVAASCDNCFSCIGMCPTGALKIKRDESGSGLLFNPSRCIGCGLCRDFCLNNSIAMQQGYLGEHYFEYETCNKESCRADTAENASCEGTKDAVCC